METEWNKKRDEKRNKVRETGVAEKAGGSDGGSNFLKAAILIGAIICISFTLRGPITAVGSLAGMIHDDLHVSNGLLGFVTTLPLLAFAVCSPLLFRISDRFGIGRVMFMGLCLSFGGVLLRSFGGIVGLFLGTSLLGMGICVGNVLIPSVIKLKFPGKIGILTSTYITGQGIFASVGAGLSYPLAANFALGWQWSLLIWCFLILIALIIWIPQIGLKDQAAAAQTEVSQTKGAVVSGQNGGCASGEKSKRKTSNLLRSRLAIRITIFMGTQSLCFYSITAWLPSILTFQGVEPDVSGYMALWFQVANIPASFLVPLIAVSKQVNQKWVVTAACLFYFIGYVGILLSSSFVVIMVVLFCAAMGSGATFAWITAIIGVKAKDAQQAAQLTGMAQSLGYLLAACGPTLCGFFYDMTGAWYGSVGLLLLVVVMMFFSGIGITKIREL